MPCHARGLHPETVADIRGAQTTGRLRALCRALQPSAESPGGDPRLLDQERAVILRAPCPRCCPHEGQQGPQPSQGTVSQRGAQQATETGSSPPCSPDNVGPPQVRANTPTRHTVNAKQATRPHKLPAPGAGPGRHSWGRPSRSGSMEKTQQIRTCRRCHGARQGRHQHLHLAARNALSFCALYSTIRTPSGM